MEHLRSAVACLVGVIAIVCLMAILLISSNTQRQSCRTELCDNLVQCELVLPRAPEPDAGKEPTLAPPRIEDRISTADTPERSPSLGQSVYVQIKTDHSDIEVGWASSEILGR
jgi:hypothetical protein